MLLRNMLLGGVSHGALFAPEGGAGSGGAAGGTSDGGAAAGSKVDAGAGASAAGAGAGAGADSGAAAGAGPGAGGGADGGAAATLAGGGASTGAEAGAAAGAKPGFPDNWRDLIAGDDKDFRKRLDRFGALPDLAKSYRELETKLSKGELKPPATPFPKDGDDAAKAEWRKTNGLPDKAEGYIEKIALPDGLVIGEADKPLVASFAKTAFEQGASQAEVDRAVSWFYSQQDAAKAERAEADGASKTTTMQTLMTEWGPQDYKGNMNAMGTFLAAMPADLKNNMLAARTETGERLGNTAEFIKWASQQGREFFPAATIVPAGDANAVATIANEIKTIEASMYDASGQPNRAYWGDNAKQARYRELIDAQQKMTARGKAA